MGRIMDCKCLKCGYCWAKRANDNSIPAVCPRCSNKKWWLPRTRTSPLKDLKLMEVKKAQIDIIKEELNKQDAPEFL